MNFDDSRRIAETFLDEMLDAEARLDFAAWTRRFEPRDIMNFGETRFRKDMHCIREDLGDYRSREYLGSLKAFENADNAGRRPDGVRHVWRAVFEKNETLIVVGIHERDGTRHVNEFIYHH